MQARSVSRRGGGTGGRAGARLFPTFLPRGAASSWIAVQVARLAGGALPPAVKSIRFAMFRELAACAVRAAGARGKHRRSSSPRLPPDERCKGTIARGRGLGTAAQPTLPPPSVSGCADTEPEPWYVRRFQSGPPRSAWREFRSTPILT